MHLFSECEVTGLTPGKEYRFRVAAVNSEGESEPLTSEESIIAKNPYDEPGKLRQDSAITEPRRVHFC